MTNEIEKFSLEDEKQLLSEMEMLEVYGGSAAAGSSFQAANGCKCKTCTGNSNSGSMSGDQSKTSSGNHNGICASGCSGNDAFCPTGSMNLPSGSSGTSGGGK